MSDPWDDTTPEEEDDGQEKLFQLGLRDLFIVNAAAAVIFGIVRLVMTEAPMEQVLCSPAIWIFCAGATIVLSFLGAAVGREPGAILCTIGGGVMWAVVVWGCWTIDPKMQKYIYLPAQALGIVVTVGPILFLAIREMRRPEPIDDEPSDTTQRLLDTKKEFRESQTHREGEE